MAQENETQQTVIPPVTAPRSHSDLMLRIKTAGVLILVVVAALLISSFWPVAKFSLLAIAYLAVGLAALEYAKLENRLSRQAGKLWMTFSLVMIAPTGFFLWWSFLRVHGAASASAEFPFICFVLFFVSELFSLVWLSGSRTEGLLERASILRDLFPAVFFIGLGGSSLIALAALPQAPLVVGWLLFVVCVNDTAAYFVGKSVGGPKLSPLLSPGKTWSGSVGGLFAGLLAGWAGSYLFPVFPGVWAILLITGVTVIAAQLGDLLKSYWKRLAGVKDSGALLPGHGGVLDRIDGILMASPVTLFALSLFGI